MSKEFKNFIVGNNIRVNIICTVVCGAFGAFFAYLFTSTPSSEDNVIFWILFAGALLGCVFCVVDAIKNALFPNKLKKNNLAERVEMDFCAAVSMANNTIRFGKEWIFIKGKRKLLEYSEIKQIYERIEIDKIKKTQKSHSVQYVDERGHDHTLCWLSLSNESRAEAMKIFKLIIDKNPNVKVGYKA